MSSPHFKKGIGFELRSEDDGRKALAAAADGVGEPGLLIPCSESVAPECLTIDRARELFPHSHEQYHPDAHDCCIVVVKTSEPWRRLIPKQTGRSSGPGR